jgi:hypothetical protein
VPAAVSSGRSACRHGPGGGTTAPRDMRILGVGRVLYGPMSVTSRSAGMTSWSDVYVVPSPGNPHGLWEMAYGSYCVAIVGRTCEGHGLWLLFRHGHLISVTHSSTTLQGKAR